jgi:hypothetical protein
MKVGLLELLHEVNGALKTNPFESGLLAVDCVALLNQADGLEDVGDVVETAYLGLQLLVFFLLLGLLTCRDHLGGFLETEDVLPSDEEMDELLAEDAQTLLLLVLLDLATGHPGHLLLEFDVLFV